MEDLNRRPSLWQATGRLLEDLEPIDSWVDRLIARAPSVKSREDLAAWEKERGEVENLLANTLLALRWVEEEQEARLRRADPHVHKALEWAAAKRRAREQYEQDRAKRQSIKGQGGAAGCF